MKKFALAGAAIAALASTATPAQPTDGGRQAALPLTRSAVAAKVDAGFVRLDVNRDGAVTRDEVRARAEARRSHRDQAGGQQGGARRERQEDRGERRAALFAQLDANRDGSISRAEFEARPALSREDRAERRSARTERRAKRGEMRGSRAGGGMFARFGGRQFEVADADRDGRLTQAEARQSALALFDRVDANRDGTISQDERRAAREAFAGRRRRG